MRFREEKGLFRVYRISEERVECFGLVFKFIFSFRIVGGISFVFFNFLGLLRDFSSDRVFLF